MSCISFLLLFPSRYGKAIYALIRLINMIRIKDTIMKTCNTRNNVIHVVDISQAVDLYLPCVNDVISINSVYFWCVCILHLRYHYLIRRLLNMSGVNLVHTSNYYYDTSP